MKILYLKFVIKNFKIIKKSRFLYQFIINSLMYAILNIRLNIVYAIFVIFYYIFNFNNFY